MSRRTCEDAYMGMRGGADGIDVYVGVSDELPVKRILVQTCNAPAMRDKHLSRDVRRLCVETPAIEPNLFMFNIPDRLCAGYAPSASRAGDDFSPAAWRLDFRVSQIFIIIFHNLAHASRLCAA